MAEKTDLLEGTLDTHTCSHPNEPVDPGWIIYLLNLRLCIVPDYTNPKIDS